MIQIAPWEKSLIKEIEKAIMASDIGITPNNDGAVIMHAPLPFIYTVSTSFDLSSIALSTSLIYLSVSF